MELGEVCDSDNYIYCSNRFCKNHSGEGIFRYKPSWVEILEKKEISTVNWA